MARRQLRRIGASQVESLDEQIEDAQNDVAKQQSQIQNFIASGVSAIIVNPVDTDATAAMSKAAAEAGIALVLRGAGYENETAADMVFKPRSSGGLAAAIEYACKLVA